MSPSTAALGSASAAVRRTRPSAPRFQVGFGLPLLLLLLHLPLRLRRHRRIVAIIHPHEKAKQLVAANLQVSFSTFV